MGVFSPPLCSLLLSPTFIPAQVRVQREAISPLLHSMSQFLWMESHFPPKHNSESATADEGPCNTVIGVSTKTLGGLEDLLMDTTKRLC
jgi:hypothetical protein